LSTVAGEIANAIDLFLACVAYLLLAMVHPRDLGNGSVLAQS
jgi:hypothetical protein